MGSGYTEDLDIESVLTLTLDARCRFAPSPVTAHRESVDHITDELMDTESCPELGRALFFIRRAPARFSVARQFLDYVRTARSHSRDLRQLIAPALNYYILCITIGFRVCRTDFDLRHTDGIFEPWLKKFACLGRRA